MIDNYFEAKGHPAAVSIEFLFTDQLDVDAEAVADIASKLSHGIHLPPVQLIYCPACELLFLVNGCTRSVAIYLSGEKAVDGRIMGCNRQFHTELIYDDIRRVAQIELE